MSIESGFNKLIETKEAIKTALSNKGVEVGDKFSEYASGVDDVETRGKFKIEYADLTTAKNSSSNSIFGVAITSADVTGLVTDKWTNLRCTLVACSNLTSIVGLDTWDTSNVTNMEKCFWWCSKLTSIEDLRNWDVSKVTMANNMLSSCPLITDFSPILGWDTSSLQYASDMFNSSGLSGVVDFSKWDLSSLIQGSNMFANTKIEEITIPSSTASSLSGTGGITSFFNNCKSLKKVNFNLKVPDGWTGYINSMFVNCTSLEEVYMTDFNYKPSNSAQGTFNNCPALKSVYFGTWDWANLTSYSMFNYFMTNSTLLENFIGNLQNVKLFSTYFQTHNQPNLTRESALTWINGLYDYAADGDTSTHTFRFHSDTLARLTDEDIAIATSKGWTLSN